jgi:hypothetical protein
MYEMKFEERQLDPGPKVGFDHKYLWRLIKWIDRQEEAAIEGQVKLQFFSQSLNPLDSAGEFLNPILCVFNDGTFMLLTPGFYGEHARLYMGPRYVTLKAWAFLPLPEGVSNPASPSKWHSFYAQTNTILGEGSHRDLVVADFYFIWQNGPKGAIALASTLASLWKKGYDTISSLGSALTKSLNSCVTSSESLSCSNTPDTTSNSISEDTKSS